MKRTAALVTAAQVGTVQPVTAYAEVKRAKVPPSRGTRTYTSSSSGFNEPRNPSLRCELWVRSINGMSCGQTVRVAMFSISDSEPSLTFADALVAAHQRDVIVKVRMDRHSDNNLVVRSAGGRA